MAAAYEYVYICKNDLFDLPSNPISRIIFGRRRQIGRILIVIIIKCYYREKNLLPNAHGKSEFKTRIDSGIHRTPIDQAVIFTAEIKIILAKQRDKFRRRHPSPNSFFFSFVFFLFFPGFHFFFQKLPFLSLRVSCCQSVRLSKIQFTKALKFNVLSPSPSTTTIIISL